MFKLQLHWVYNKQVNIKNIGGDDMTRKNENNVIEHLLDNFFTATYSDLSLKDYENLYDIKEVKFAKMRTEEKDDVKCMIINNKLYCEKIKEDE